MNQIRILLYIALAAVLFSLWQAWQKDYPSSKTVASESLTSANSTSTSLPPAEMSSSSTIPKVAPTPESELNSSVPTSAVDVTTDVLKLKIDTRGGNFAELSLLKYPKSTQNPDIPVALLHNDPANLYIAQSGLIGSEGPDRQQGQAQFTPEKTSYTLAPEQKTLDVKMSWINGNGLKITKVFTFQRGSYAIKVHYDIENNSLQPWSGQIYGQLRQKPESTSSSIFSLHTYFGGSVSTPPTEKFEKIPFSKMESSHLDRTATGGWLAMQQRYFLNTWIPDQNQSNHFYSRYDGNGTYTLGFVGPLLEVLPKNTAHTMVQFYGGPEIVETLAALAPHLELTVDYGWLWPISVGIFWIMKHIYNWVGNWGWSIVLVTLLIKIVFYKLSETSYRSMAKMRRLTPRLLAIKERFGDDRQKMSLATMELYKKEKVSPMSGCLPMVVQIPFFIALYYVLIESVELRQAPFILWIKDLSVQDPYFVLPILMGISMFLQQRLNPPPTDPMQAKIMLFLPVLLTLFFIAFPAGLVLYWLVNNCLSALQQWYVLKQTERAAKLAKA